MHAQNVNQGHPAEKPEIQRILSNLSSNLDQFEYLQKKLETSGKNNTSYDENKNIWLSSVLAVQAISSICENEQDLLNLFWDLKSSRRMNYIDVRIRSLDTSIRQLNIMMEQIRINHKLLPPDLAEIDMFNGLKIRVNSTIDLLRSSIALIKNK